MNAVLVIIPTFNERENLPLLTAAVLKAEPRADILIVDDNSPDGTGAVADELAVGEPRIQVMHRQRKEGLGRAYLAAFGWGLARGYALFVEMDADFSHDPEALPTLIDAAESGADLVLGSRYVEGGGTRNWGFLRKAISRGGSIYARMLLGVAIRDLTGGFKCFRRKVLEAIDLDAVTTAGYGFQIELTYRALQRGFTVKEVPIVFEDRRAGESKMSKAIFLEAIVAVWKLRFVK